MDILNYLRDEVFAGHGVESKLFYSFLALFFFILLKRILLLFLLRSR